MGSASIFSSRIELVAQSLGVNAANVSRWKEKADNEAQMALKSNECDSKDLEIKALHTKVGELTIVSAL